MLEALQRRKEGIDPTACLHVRSRKARQKMNLETVLLVGSKLAAQKFTEEERASKRKMCGVCDREKDTRVIERKTVTLHGENPESVPPLVVVVVLVVEDKRREQSNSRVENGYIN